MTATETVRVVCPGCNESHPVRPWGRLPAHLNQDGKPCTGSLTIPTNPDGSPVVPVIDDPWGEDNA